MRTTRVTAVARVAAIAALVALVLASCPQPISGTIVSRVTDKAVPVMTISAPTTNSAYTQTVLVQGKQSKPGMLKSLGWTVTGTLGVLASGTVPLGSIAADGSFQFQFSTLTFSGPIAVNVSARDWNDNVGQSAFTLTAPGASISSFTATAGSKSVQLSWESIAGATYTLYYTDNGTLPTQTNGHTLSIASSPYAMTSLSNGNLYTFLLQAHTASADYWSAYTVAMPLSQFTLAPMVTGDYRKLNLEWSQITGSSSFIVQRSTSASGPFADYSGVVQGYSYTDTAVSDGTWYWYKVRPTVAGAIASAYNAAQTMQIAPSLNQAVASILTSTAANKVEIYGSYAFVAAGSSGLIVVDVSAPGSPAIVASLPTANALDLSIDAAGHYAYVANGASGLISIDISNPLAPVLAGTATWASANATAVSVVSGYAFVLDSSTGNSVHAVKIVAAPYSLTPTGVYSNATYPIFSHMVATYATNNGVNFYYFFYIACGSVNGSVDRLLEIYAASPDTMSSATGVYGSYTDGAGSTGYYSGRLWVKPQTVAGDRLYVLASAKTMLEPPPGYALQIFQKWPNPSLVKQGQAISSGYYGDLSVVGTSAYVADGIGLQQVDVSVEATPVMGRRWNTPGASTGVASNGTTGFMASGSLGFQTVDLSQPGSSTVSGSYAPGAMTASKVRGNLVYVTSGSGTARLQIVDISSPASPAPLGNVGMTGPSGLAITGGYALVADGSAGLRVVDVSNPSNPIIVGTGTPISGSLSRVAVKGDYAYAASGSGMQIFDISDPTKPVVVGFMDTDGLSTNDVALRGTYAYMADGTYFQANGLKVIDVSNPALPFQVGKSSVGMTMWRVALSGDYAYVSDNNPISGLFAININPSSASFLAHYGFCKTNSGGSNGSYGVAAFGTWAYVADSTATTGGLSLVDISAPTALANASFKSTLTLTGAQDVVLSGRYAYVCDSGGLRVIRLF